VRNWLLLRHCSTAVYKPRFILVEVVSHVRGVLSLLTYGKVYYHYTESDRYVARSWLAAVYLTIAAGLCCRDKSWLILTVENNLPVNQFTVSGPFLFGS
jgi:hypothetical protein